MYAIKTIYAASGEKLRGLWKTIIYSLIEMLFVIIPYIIVIYALQNLHVGMENTNRYALYAFAIMLICMAIRLFFRWKGYYNTQIKGVDFSTDLRRKVGDHYRGLSLGYFNGRDLGELSGEMLKSATDVENIVTDVFANSLVLASGLLLFLLGLFAIDYRLGLSVIGMVVISVPLIMLSNRMARKYGSQNLKAAFGTSDKVLEYVYGIKTIKSYNLGLDQMQKTKDALRQQYKMSIKTEFKVAPYVQAFGMMVDLALPVGMLVALSLVNAGQIENMRVLSFFLSAPRIFTMVFLLSVMFTELRINLNSVDSLSEVLNVPVQSCERRQEPESLDISFKNVSFSYQDKSVLNHISFSIPEGSFTAIVGPSGSGKTTIANLIARFWDVNDGKIMLGGANIRSIPPDQLLSRMSFVFQNVYLFNDTIYNNVTLGDNDAYTNEQVFDAMKAAQMDEFVLSLPDGYDTMVGESGATLSGGEKQRISIARALLKNAPILILDEATASLDAENEHLIQEAFNVLTKEKTLIVIAHRLSTIEYADQILVLSEDGHLVEAGRHEDLNLNNGQYRKLWEAQQEAVGWSV